MLNVRLLWMMGCLLIVMLFIAGCGSERMTAADYEDRDLEVPYGSAVEDHDFSEEADAIRDAGEKVADAATDAVDRLAGYADTAGEVLDAADDVSDAIRAGAKKVGSLAERATDLINNIP